MSLSPATPPTTSHAGSAWSRLARALATRATGQDWWGFFAGRGSDEALAVALGWATGAPPPGAHTESAREAAVLLERLGRGLAVQATVERFGLDQVDTWLLLGVLAMSCDGPVGEVLAQRAPSGVPAWRWARWLVTPDGTPAPEVRRRLGRQGQLHRSGLWDAGPAALPGAHRLRPSPAAARFLVDGERALAAQGDPQWVQWRGQAEVLDALRARLTAPGRGPLLVLGPAGSGRRSAVRQVCAETQRACASLENLGGFEQAVDAAVWARLNGGVLLAEARRGASPPPLAPLRRALAFEAGSSQHGLPCVLVAEPDDAAAWLEAWPELMPVTWPTPDVEGQARVFQSAMAARGWATPADQVSWLAQTYALTPREVGLALDDLGPGRGRLADAEFDGRVRARVRTALASLADPVEVHEGWDALVLAASQRAVVDEIVAHAQHGPTVLQAWGFEARFGPRHGIACLFSGPPGTGKTLTAGLIAQALGLPAFRVDLARVVDKYVGETEKNLGRLFDEAERVPVVLVFDEADALFGERTEQRSSQDRYANLEVNYLLQRMERFGGISVLTTNRAAVIDPAFRRRLRFHVHFDLPEVADRRRLWAAMIPPGCLLGEVDFDALAGRWRISGALIRKAVLRGAFLAAARGRALDNELLDEATRLELSEAGRLASER